jgi:hypothetical protein
MGAPPVGQCDRRAREMREGGDDPLSDRALCRLAAGGGVEASERLAPLLERRAQPVCGQPQDAPRPAYEPGQAGAAALVGEEDRPELQHLGAESLGAKVLTHLPSHACEAARGSAAGSTAWKPRVAT